ncbi:Histidinol-phosphate aminotransferase [Seminavis robusta]|uniref:histidinol-phosphate transaminase n=1 Tax=Seminavis robusta TaxID=568900 RepID=A0A9N8H1G5_9STRA|nr:Histidinol-phosphate aminotransferase [Seminavis robusta]|eukprot:Sro40_g024770.1 Histidinol-phosphate aminotransferase (377) ;mRNA; r:97175-98508
MAEEKKSDPSTGIAHLLARKNILELSPYRCARDDYSEGVLLDANENAYGPTSLPTNSLDPYDNHNTLERYPDPYQTPMKELFCKYRGCGITPAHVFVGVGSDEAIDLLMRIFCQPAQDKILTTPPTYGMYKVCAKVNDVGIITVPLEKDFSLRVPEMLAAVTPEVKLLFICSPGNPTAKAIPLSVIEAVAKSQYKGLVVVDEAYVDFSTEGSAISLVNQYPNIVVLQTLSKAFGLAGIRCGFCIGGPDVIQLMNNVKAPYNVNALTSEVAINALQKTNVLQDNIAKVLAQRKVVMEKLNNLDFVTEVFPSDSNFVLFRMKEKALECYKQMADGGVVTRYRGTEIHCENCIRVTIGTEEENNKFLALLETTFKALQG